jgi:hypothetical protein
MNSSDAVQVQRLYQKVAPEWFFRELCQRHGYGFREGIYSAAVVVWLMIWQRLRGSRSLAAAVQHLVQGEAGDLQNGCKRWIEEKVSAATGSYCQARQRLPRHIVREVTERMVTGLRTEMQEGWTGLQRPVFVIDGSSLRLQHTTELVKAYSPGRNRHGENHWPVMRIVVFHDVFSGLALLPSWGPMYGDQPVSEQALAETALEKLPPEAVVVGDGNFGIFAFAYATEQSGRPLIVRLTQSRAQRILGCDMGEGMDRKVIWQASRWDRKAHPQLPEGASLEGRVMVCRNPSRPGELLYLFTTPGLGWGGDRRHLQTALERGDGSALAQAHGGLASTQLQKCRHGGKRTAAGGSGLQSCAHRHVYGGAARQSHTAPAQFFICPDSSGSGPAGFRLRRHRRGIPAADGSYVALCRTGQTPSPYPEAIVSEGSLGPGCSFPPPKEKCRQPGEGEMTLAQAPSIPVQSSLLANVRYNHDESILQLEFCDGAIYQYFDVPAEIYTSLLTAESKGNYFNHRIRGHFRHVLLRCAR